MDMYPYVPPSPYQASGSSSKPKLVHPRSFTAPSSATYSPFPPSLTTAGHASSSRSIASSPATPLGTPYSSSSYNTGKRPKLAKKATSSSAAKQRGVQASLEAQVDKYRGWQAFFLPPKPVPNGPPCSPVLGATRPAGTHGEMDTGGDDSDLSRSTSNSSTHPQQHCAMGLPNGFGTEAMQLQLQMQMQFQMRQGEGEGEGQKGKGKAVEGARDRDYFGRWTKGPEQWVEDVDVEAMDLDME